MVAAGRMPQPKLKVTTAASAKKPSASRASALAVVPPSQPAIAKASVDDDDEVKHASPPQSATTPTLTPTSPPTQSTTTTTATTPAAQPADDEELDNPLNFPQPLLSYDEIINRYLTVPSAKADLAQHANDPRWLDYCQLANTGRQERNVWTVFSNACDHYKDKRAVVWLDGDGRIEHDWTFGQLKQRIRRVAYWLSEVKGVVKGERVILCFVPGLDYFVGFWACLSLGVVAVPGSTTAPLTHAPPTTCSAPPHSTDICAAMSVCRCLSVSVST